MSGDRLEPSAAALRLGWRARRSARSWAWGCIRHVLSALAVRRALPPLWQWAWGREFESLRRDPRGWGPQQRIEPVTPVVDLPKCWAREQFLGEGQPQYKPLPAIVGADGETLTRWRLSWRARLRVLVTGDLYVSQLTFGQPLQPILVEDELTVIPAGER